MRIITGRFRGRKLLTRPGLVTRPITDRVKEKLFENLGGELNGERVADVFSGTGTIGFEALSRGAKSVVFFEKDPQAFELLQRNRDRIGAGSDVFLWQTDILRTSFRPKGLAEFYPYDLIFFDPPYAMIKQLQPGKPFFKSFQRLGRPDVSAENARIILRVPEKAEYEIPETWKEEWNLEFSSMEIHVLRKQPSVEALPD
ncbi:MAG: RsmD family RNA methyltransferase [Planctomycetota bacterium]|nr:RsmD family RNA methyltransferase [Planctomycetota bacterium]